MAEDPAAYGHRGTRAVQRMVEYAPSTGGLALWVAHENLRDAGAGALQQPAKPPPVATDGRTLFYSAAFDGLSVAEQAGLVAHEVLHIALRHPQRYLDLRQLVGDVDLQLFNICADAIVNSALGHLGWLELPASAVRLDTLLGSALAIDQPAEAALLEWDVERLYRAVDDRRPVPGGGTRETQSAQRAGARQAGGAAGRHEARAPVDPAPSSTRDDGPRAARVRALGAKGAVDLLPDAGTQGLPEAEAEQAREWSERLLRAHTGDGEFSMLRALIADLPRMRTPWEQVLRSQLARALSTRPGVAWSRPARSYIANQGRAGVHRRMPWEPGFSGTRPVPRLVVVVDVSGSIEASLMDRFAREVESITRRLEAALVLVIGDDRVRRVARFEPGRSDLRAIEFTGGGGTDFTPLLVEADKHRPDIVVVLTDLDGPAHFRARWPVIWAVPEPCERALQPFGRKLALR